MSSGKRISFSRLGVRTQLVILFLGVFGGVFAAFAAGMYFHLREVHRKEFDAALFNYVVEVSHTWDRTQGNVTVPLGADMILPFSLGETLLQITDDQGKAVLRSPSLGSRDLPRPAASGRKAAFTNVPFEDAPGPAVYRMVSHAFTKPGAGTFTVQAAAPMQLLDRQEEETLLFLSVAVPVVLVLAALAALAFSRRAMAPVSAIIAKANEIEAEHLSAERIPVPDSRDELRELALTLNGLLDRLRRAFQNQEAFIADASHELKTPLAVLKGELEMLERKGLTDPGEVRAFLESARQEVDSLTKLVENLLLLARMGGHGGWAASRFRLDERLLDCVARFTRVARKRGITLSLDLEPSGDRTFEFLGEPELIRSLVDNLLDNAVKYSPDGGVVSVRLEETDREFRLTVRDTGPGIPPTAFPQLFDRYFRDESTRDRIPGSGLGLPMVKRIAELHRGDVEAANLPTGGASFTVRLPKA